MINPYILQVARQTGMSYSEARKSVRTAAVKLERARAMGFDTVEEYEEALHDFLNSQ